MQGVTVVDHPLVQHKLSLIRDKSISTKSFRELLKEIGMLLCYEVTRDLPLAEVEVETPLARMQAAKIAGKKLVFVPVLRAGVTFALSWFNGEEAEFELVQKAGFSYVKLDGAFAAVIARQPKKKAELAAIVQRCRQIGVQTVCMQVEDEETLQHLRLLRVDYVQGFGVERPTPLEGKPVDR